MSLQNIDQLQALNRIMKKQIEQYDIAIIAILGVAGGNGLEHAVSPHLQSVYGIDINAAYLQSCWEHFGNLGDRLFLHNMDLLA